MSDLSNPQSQSERTPPAPGRQLDWAGVARQFARGVPLEEIAREFGVSVARIERNFERSQRFLDRIERERKRLAEDAALPFERLALQVSDGLERLAAEGDAKVLLWLAQRFNLGQRPIKWPPKPEFTQTPAERRQTIFKLAEVAREVEAQEAAARQALEGTADDPDPDDDTMPHVQFVIKQ